MNILAIETSCDETSVAIVRDGRYILSNVVASQIDLHRKYGGVVPELASRQHVLTIVPVLEEAFERAGLSWVNIDAVAVTRGPGLSPALLVGVNAAKAIAFARSKPLVAVNHIEGHIYSNWLIPEKEAAEGRAQPEPRLPAVLLVVSGGHTELVFMTGHGQYRLLGKTVDDAAGEAFDKAARILGLGYPGGPAIQKASEQGDHERFNFPRATVKGTYDFSFSGVKTALLRKVQEFGIAGRKPEPWQKTEARTAAAQPARPGSEAPARNVPHMSLETGKLVDISSFSAEDSPAEVPQTQVHVPVQPPPPVRVAHTEHPEERRHGAEVQSDQPLPVSDLAASFQAAVVDALIEKTAAAADEFRAAEVLVAGGVAANALLRERLGDRLRVPFRYPPLVLCTDNAAMIAAAAYYRFADSVQHDFTLDIEPNARYV
jgi:N6-L-threonylcarbamoyladenine synthase